ncbi:MAG: hypothetical protein V3R76_10815 [Gammaproteobacteria bacterium]
MRFSRDSGVTDFCSCKIGIPYIPVHNLRAGMRYLLLLLPWTACMQALQEQKPAARKSLFLKASNGLVGAIILTILNTPIPMAQAAEIRDPMEPPAYALQKFRQAKWKKANTGVKKASVVKKTAAKPMQLTSILYSPERKIAIIDDQTLRVGDAIRNAKLIKINKGSVRLMKKGKFIDLLLNDELTAIKKITIERKL